MHRQSIPPSVFPKSPAFPQHLLASHLHLHSLLSEIILWQKIMAVLDDYASYVPDIFTFLQNALLASLCMSAAMLSIFP